MRLWLISLFCWSSPAIAGLPSYDNYLPTLLKQNSINSSMSITSQSTYQCDAAYEPFTNKGVLDIRYVLGYFDATNGKEYIEDGINYGYSPSIDPSVFSALEKKWSAACLGTEQLCNFTKLKSQESLIIFEKQILHLGRPLKVRITLAKSSLSENLKVNMNSALQKSISEQAESIFLDGLKQADIVFYNGHSRSGGGPDFHLPILNNQMTVDYKNHYQVFTPGKIKMISALQTRSPKLPSLTLGLFSCSSNRFFKNELNKNMSVKLITSSDLVDYFETLQASVNFLEAILQGLCGKSLHTGALPTVKLRQNFELINF